jgi:hypothetical protein
MNKESKINVNIGYDGKASFAQYALELSGI